jgi:hypothetical protein
MHRLAIYLPSILLLLGLALPFAGPLLDHHFADRQPGHKHLLSVAGHLHAIDSPHDHLSGGTEGNAGSEPTTSYNYDTGFVASAETLRDATDLLSAELYEPTSVFILPPPRVVTMMGQSVSPPARPPRLLS